WGAGGGPFLLGHHAVRQSEAPPTSAQLRLLCSSSTRLTYRHHQQFPVSGSSAGSLRSADAGRRIRVVCVRRSCFGDGVSVSLSVLGLAS
ncbi:hypothetical protein LDENG_00110750, partial [Lucifuga dentata]